MAAAILSRFVVAEVIRFFYDRPRPFKVFDITPLIAHSAGASFPSGHAAFYFALALPIFLIDRKWGWYAIVAAVLIGMARVFVGVHWPLDILAGLLVASLSVYTIKLFFPLLNRQQIDSRGLVI